jgi:glycosyltransferase involved in cell wall biosynthesis
MRASPRACIVSVVRPVRDVRTFHREARSLVAAGWEVVVVGRGAGGPAVDGGVHVLPLAVGSGARRVLAQLSAVRLALATRADVYAVADPELLPAALLLRRRGRAVIYDCIEDYPAYMALKAWLPPRTRRAAGKAVARIERLACRWLDAVITPDEGTAARLGTYGAPVAVVHNFPRRDEFAPPPGTTRAHDVLYHGSLPAYHLRALAEIAGALARWVPHARWAVVGEPDSPTGRTEFETALAQAGVRGCVHLLPRVPFPQVPALVHTTRSGVVPLPDVAKFRTNLPMKLFEYMAAGVPAVASDLPPARALVRDGEGVVFAPPGDPRAFGDALSSLLADDARAERIGRRGREAVCDRFHWEREERTLLRVYAAALWGPGVRPVARELHA